ncbi:MBL fold metallo-hydrolase [Clostridium sp. YIM B02505]|uniref:MBL fold metallo-hydrolase n=1 Tax=Clostridium yunnanense TaxID=2800325 RepID=A0ABS1EUM1_9CLOT|nr:MBL fold metallo-hydrolase [Clostridium yunnanense]MBK1813005.1 MBL fold metallo-hydrolase [Clostridium yunnanense]
MNRVIPLQVSFGSIDNLIFPVILNDDSEMVLIDCGYIGSFELIKKAAMEVKVDLSKLTKIIITHHDHDHIGALGEFKKSYPNVKVISSFNEEKYISGREKSLRLQQAERIFKDIPDDKKEEALKFHEMLQAVKPVEVDICVKDKDTFDCCGGIEIIETPGHMPGHISVYLKESKTLVTGDAMVAESGKLCIANPQYTLDIEEARKSIEKFLQYDIEKIICYHGGICTERIKESIEQIVSK